MKKEVKKKISKKRFVLRVFLILIALGLAVGIYNFVKPLPEGLSVQGEVHRVSDENLEFLYDLTYTNEAGERVLEQKIFEEIFKVIDEAEKFILIDMFLFNSGYSGKERSINITTDLKNKLIDKKKENPEIEITFISDPINTLYGSYESPELSDLEDGGVNVVITDLTKLRDINPLYSGFWRVYLRRLGTSGTNWISNPIGGDSDVSLRAIGTLFNLKANHRKVLVADSPEGMVSIVTSANPHEASSTSSNIGFLVRESGIWKDIVESESSIVEFSGGTISKNILERETEEEGEIEIQLVTEGKIRDNLIRDIDSTEEGDEIDMGIFYLSDRRVILSLLKASDRGVNIRMVLDPNKDAFAREKSGIPNRQSAYELNKKSDGEIEIRWYETFGEQFHTKLVVIKKDGKIIVYGGSANLTRRNIGDYNSELNLRILSPETTEFVASIEEYFERIWSNQDGKYTVEYSKFHDGSKVKYWKYRFQEGSGFSSF